MKELFVAEYIKNGENGTKAYFTVRPHVSSNSAAVCANRLLKKPAIQYAIQKVVDKRFDESIASREHLITEANEIGKEAWQKGAHGSALKAVDLKAKLNKLYDKDHQDENSTLINIWQQIKIVPGSENEPTQIIDSEIESEVDDDKTIIISDKKEDSEE
jgi:hypothetical protein